MGRVWALLLIPSLVAMSATRVLLHAHAYDPHDHPEHHHGWSAHHHAAAADFADGRARLKDCDPGQHAIRFSFVCASPPPAPGSDAESTLPARPHVEIWVECRLRHTDIRVHGPPPRTQSSPRAPPDHARLIT